VIVAEIGVVTDLAVTAETKQNGLGWFDPTKMKANVDFVEKYIGVSGKLPLATDV
jgi:NitT/TauT family transport system substrate-binding protein